MSFTPTDEQMNVLDLAADQGVVACEALAGTGKTATLELIAAQEARKHRTVLYLAFNKSIAVEAGERLGANATAKTFHSMAFGAVGRPLAGKLRAPRKSPLDLARLMGLDPIVVTTPHETKKLRAGYLSGVVMRTIARWCASADPDPNLSHVPWVKGLGPYDEATKEQYGQYVLDQIPAAWADITSPDGLLPYTHDHYLKLWDLSDPWLPFEVVLFDEAQDASPVMSSIIAKQSHAQVVYVGDSRQEIYGWRGAVNAMANVDADRTGWLTQSFRFGPEIAAAANEMLVKLESEKTLIGSGPSGTVAPLDAPDAVLARTNGEVFVQALAALAAGRKPYVVGGLGEVSAFARAARDLMNGRDTYHHDLAPFSSWQEVERYVAEDMLGAELAMLVKIINEHGPDRIIDLADEVARIREHQAGIILSTAHKSKGRQWPTVRLSGDFPEPGQGKPGEVGVDLPSGEELRLLYVAATRAQRQLDPFRAWPWQQQP